MRNGHSSLFLHRVVSGRDKTQFYIFFRSCFLSTKLRFQAEERMTKKDNFLQEKVSGFRLKGDLFRRSQRNGHSVREQVESMV
jgi:hypothetical protein